SHPDRVLATAKHFAGDGLTTYGTGSNLQTTGNYPIDQGVDLVNHAKFRRLALSPYVPAVRKHHVGAVMPSYSDVDWTEDGLGNRINMHGNRGAAAPVASDGAAAPVAIKRTTPGRRIFSRCLSIPPLSLTLVS